MQVHRQSLWVIAGAALAVMLPANAHAGVVPVSRSSSISLDAVAGADEFHQNRGTDQYGQFNQSLSYDHTDDASGVHARGTASQNTTFDLTSSGQIQGTGSLLADAFVEFTDHQNLTGPGNAGADSKFSFIFDVIDHSEPFNISGDMSGLSTSLTLDGNVIASTTDPLHPPVFSTQLDLTPGRHTFAGDIFAGSSGSSPQDPYSYGQSSNLSFDLAVGTAATSIPLPPGLWTGATGLLAAAGVIGLGRRRRFQVG